MLTSTFNTKSTELESKIKDADIIAKSAVTKANSIKSDLDDYAKKVDVANDITTIKNDYVSNAGLTSRLNDLKSQHIPTEVKTIDDKTKKNASDILGFESRLKQKEDIVDEVQRENALTSGRDYYLDKMYLLYECKAFSFKYTSGKINLWKSTGVNNYSNYSRDSDMDAVSVATTSLPPLIDNGQMSVRLEGAYFKQMRLLRPNNDNIVNIYIVYLIGPISNSRNPDYTVQNALFGGVKITKNATDTSKHKYEGYGICFDEGGTFSKGGINNGRNVLIFGVHENSLVHANNKANNFYVMDDIFVQGINDTTLYAEKIYNQNFTAANKKFVLSLHYNSDSSYLFVNGKRELKFKAKDDQIVKEILCLGNISDDWTAANAQKTGLWGEIYDFAVDYTSTNIGDIYSIHRYLMKKHNINTQFFRTYKMLIINLAISLFSTLKVGALECVSVVNQKCMPRPKILNVNEGISEALFYPYNVLVNKCSGSCDTLDNPMSKICVRKIIKNVNMKVYNFLMRLNETRIVLWHENCKCVCRLNSSVCNRKHIWNSDTCRCDCNEDFAGVVSCDKGYTWNPSTCECQCDRGCKTGQYLDHKNCAYKNKLVGRLIEECTNTINETLINNKDNIDNCNTIQNVFIVLFSVVVLIGIICFCLFAYFKWFKGKKLFKKYIDY